MTITGLMLTAYTTSQSTRYFGLFLVAMGSSGCIPAVLAYVGDGPIVFSWKDVDGVSQNANNVVSHTKVRELEYSFIYHLADMGFSVRYPLQSLSQEAASVAFLRPLSTVIRTFPCTIHAFMTKRLSFKKKSYLNGIWATMGCQILMLLLLAINTIVFTHRNKLAERGEIIIEGTPGFLYTI